MQIAYHSTQIQNFNYVNCSHLCVDYKKKGDLRKWIHRIIFKVYFQIENSNRIEELCFLIEELEKRLFICRRSFKYYGHVNNAFK